MARIRLGGKGVGTAASGTTPTVKGYLGSNCSGNDGETARVLTLDNTSTTTNVIVGLGGVWRKQNDDFTVSHLSASSTITFNVSVTNDQNIVVVYWV